MGRISRRSFLKSASTGAAVAAIGGSDLASAQAGSSRTSALDAIALPKGGGALRGIGENFAPDLFTGTGNFGIPIELPAGRNGFQPSLRLAYSSGNGNSPFGLGWALDVPSISRRTSKGVPEYTSRDTFLLSGLDDLILVSTTGPVSRYRPRTEATFARIEHVVDANEGHDFWRVRGRDGLLSIYGTPRPARATTWTDPAILADPDDPRRGFAWKLTQTQDTYGNRIEYEYVRDAQRESGSHRWDQLYLSKIRYIDYGNTVPRSFLVHVELEYEPRPDAFSDCRGGFEIRTVQRCRTIAISTEAGTRRRVRTYRLNFLNPPSTSNGLSLLQDVILEGHDDEEGRAEPLPPIRFEYGAFNPRDRKFEPVTGERLAGVSVSDENRELVDLFGRGLPDIVEMGGSARYWRNLGGGRFEQPRQFDESPGVALSDPGVQIIDADGDGRADLVVTRPGLSGYFPLTHRGGWDRRSFRRWERAPDIDLDGASVKLVDLDGDGVTDAVRAGARLMCHYNDPVLGWYDTQPLGQGSIGEVPNVDLTSPYVKWADMNGDGLTDVVIVQDGRVDYWPSFGRGRFGRRVTMTSAPTLPYGFDPRRILVGDIDGDGAADFVYVDGDHVTLWLNTSGNGWSAPIEIQGTPLTSSFDSVRLVDLLGIGISGLLWTQSQWAPTRERMFFLDFTRGHKPYLLEGIDNNMGAVTRVTYLPSTRFYLQDSGTVLAWRTSLPFPVQVVSRTEAIDRISNTRLITEYAYHHGHWDGVEREFRGFGRVDHRDTERFDGYVETRLFSPPLEVRTWFHLGAVTHRDETPGELDCRGEYWTGHASAFDRSELDSALRALPAAARRDAYGSLRGRSLRSETYALDGSPFADRPFSVTEQTYSVAVKVPPASRRAGVYFPYQMASLTTQWERGTDPQTQIAYTGLYDDYGQARLELRIAVPRARDYRSSSELSAAPFLMTAAVTTFAVRDDDSGYIVDHAASRSTHELIDDLRASGREPRPSSDEVWDRVQRWARGEQISGRTNVVAQTLNYYDGTDYHGLDLGQIGTRGALTRVEQLVLEESRLPEMPPYLQAGSPTWMADYPSEFRSKISRHREPPPRGAAILGGFVQHQASGSRVAGLFTAALQRAYNARGMVVGDRDPLGNEVRIEYGDGYDLLPTRVVDPAQLETTARYNYRVLKPGDVTDSNGSTTGYRYTPFGLLESIALLGRQGRNEGDSAAMPSTTVEYDLHAFARDRQPIYAHTTRRTTHTAVVLAPGDGAPAAGDTIEVREYSDGFGRLIQTRVRSEDLLFGDGVFGEGVLPFDQTQNGPAVGGSQAGRDINVIVSGWQVFDNKGRVVERYEPFFSSSWAYAVPEDRQRGASGVTFYDARGRVVRTVGPDGSEQRTIHGLPRDLSTPDDFVPSPWETYAYDANDNAGRTPKVPSSTRADARHWNTPSSTLVDALGRVIEKTERNGPDPTRDWHTTKIEYDIRGTVLTIRDALDRVAFACVPDMLGRPIRVEQLDGGVKRTVYDAAGDAIEERDGKGSLVLNGRDALRRPTRVWARDIAGAPVTLRQVLVYGDSAESGLARADVRLKGLAGRLYRHYDEAGLVGIEEYDFKGNVLEKWRQVLSDAAILSVFVGASATGWQVTPFHVNWDAGLGTLGEHAAALLDAKIHRTSSRYDALNRLTRIDYPADVNGARTRSEMRSNRAGLLDRLIVDGGVAVDFISYNAKAQRTLIVYGERSAAGGGPRIMTRYAYDRRTFRLVRMRTESFTTPDAVTLAPSGPALQDIAYEHDPVGNLVALHDRTPGCGVSNQPDLLDRQFVYDALYRLRSATGRECDMPLPRPWDVEPRCVDPTRTRNYRQEYVYDRAGNIAEIRHQPGSGSVPTRHLMLVPGSNRLATLSLGDPSTGTRFGYEYDPAGNLTAEATDRRLEWDAHQRLRAFRVQTSGAEPSVHAQYLYDASGERVKKVLRKQGGQIETIVYVEGLFEQHRIQATTPVEFTISHVLDGEHRVVTLRAGNDPDDATPATKFQLADHLSSAVLLIDQAGSWISREEFAPYGETSFGGYARKRFRFGGKERDQESGLCYHGARYYLPWVGRWASLDPGGAVDGLNLYAFARGAPMSYADPTGMGAEQVKQGTRAENLSTQLLENTGQMDKLKAGGATTKDFTQVDSYPGRGGSRHDILTDHFSWEVTSRDATAKTYKTAQGLNTDKVANSVTRTKVPQITKHQADVQRMRIGPPGGDGPYRERLLVVIEGNASNKEIAKIRNEIRDQLKGTGIKSGVISATRLEQLVEQKGRVAGLTAKGALGSVAKAAGWVMAIVSVVSFAATARAEGIGAAVQQQIEGMMPVHGGGLNVSESQMLEIDRTLTAMRRGDAPTPNEELGGASLAPAERNAELDALARDTLGYVPMHWQFSK
jgi:RHS repeat-associated protein